MNLQLTAPLDEVSAMVAADDAVARMLADARLATEGELLDAVEARRTQVSLSFADLDRLSDLALGYSSKCLSPAHSKTPTTKTLLALLDALALSVVLVVDGAKAAHKSPSWRPRDETHVRARSLSPKALLRARPVVMSELLRKAARPRWAGVDARTFIKAMVEQSQ
jgi:hypothetical protein